MPLLTPPSLNAFSYLYTQTSKRIPLKGVTDVRRYKTAPGAVPALMQIVKEGFVPIISQVPGFRAYYALDTGNDTVAAISVFDDQAGAEASTVKAADWLKQNLAGLVQGVPEISAGEVLVYQTKERKIIA